MTPIKILLATLNNSKIRYKGFYTFFAFSSLLTSIAMIVTQVLVGEMGQAAYEGEIRLLISLLLILSAVSLVEIVFSPLRAFFMERFTGKVQYNIRRRFAKFFIRIPFSKLEKMNSGENLSVFSNDMGSTINFITDGILNFVTQFGLLLIIFVYMFIINWQSTLIFIIAFPICIVIQSITSAPLQKYSERTLEKQAKFNAVVNDSLQNSSTIIAYSLEGDMEERYMGSYMEYYKAYFTQMKMFAILICAGAAFSILPTAILYVIAGFAVVNNNMTLAEFFAYTAIGLFASQWVLMFSQSLGSLMESKAGAVRVDKITIGDFEELGSKENINKHGDTAVSFNNVCFAYNEESPDVLTNVSFDIPMGAKVAIVGGSGSGKSTILKLLLGLYDNKSGDITVLGNSTNGIGKYNLRESFSYVPQDSFLFPLSICENITGKKEISEEERTRLEKSCRDAGIFDFINTLPDKFNSILSESAENISGGQRQRIAMARAFYKDAPIILFDETTSGLDPTTEAEILKSLESATKDKTVIMVAHRAAAKAFCDTVITMEGGRVQ